MIHSDATSSDRAAGGPPNDGRADGRSASASDPQRRRTHSANLVRAYALQRRRQRRLAAFPQLEGLPHDSAWQLLVDLFIAREEDRSVSVTSACFGAGMPTTTGLRWLRTLEDQGLVRCRVDASDLRRRLVEISEEAAAAMDLYLSDD